MKRLYSCHSIGLPDALSLSLFLSDTCSASSHYHRQPSPSSQRQQLSPLRVSSRSTVIRFGSHTLSSAGLELSSRTDRNFGVGGSSPTCIQRPIQNSCALLAKLILDSVNTRSCLYPRRLCDLSFQPETGGAEPK